MKITGKKLLAVLCTVVMLVTTIVPSLAFTASAEEVSATLTFDNTSKRTSFSTSKQVWEENDITVTNDKAASSSNVANYSKPVRFYAGSKLTVEAPGYITKIVFDCNGSYATAMKNSIGTVSGATVTVSSDKVTVTFITAVESFIVAKLSAQVRMDAITVTYTEATSTCEHANKTTTTNDATCSTAGSIVVTCKDCGATISTETINATGHKYGDWEITKEPICEEGEQQKTCSTCGDILTEKLTAEHNYINRVCTNCGKAAPSAPANKKYTFSEYTAGDQYAVNEKHTLDDYLTVITTEAHFTTDLRIYSSSAHNGYAILQSTVTISGLSFNAGENNDTLNIYGLVDGEWVLIAGVSVTSSYKDYTVNFNGKTYEQIKLDVKGSKQIRLKNITVSYHEHNYNSVVTNPTCTADGYTTYTCETCGDFYTDNKTDALGHDYKAVVTKPDCVNGGYTTYTCETCGDSYTGNETEANGHTPGEDATCTEDQKCTVCGATITDKLGHKYKEVVTDPDCVNGGYTTYTCETCGDSYTGNATEANGHTPGEETIKNEIAPDCTTPGSYDKVVYCTKCDVEIRRETVTVNATGHSYDEGVVTAPTYDAQGYTTYTCATCGYTYTDNYTDKLEKIVISKSCIVLKEAININFLISDSILVDGRDYVAVIKKGDTVVAEIPYSEWTSNGSYKVITYTGIVAKQMADLYTVVIYDGELQVSDERIDGVTEYVKRAIEAGVFTNPENAELATLLVDMLNYGAAAQIQWNYNTDNLANAIVADYQSFATQTEVTFGEDIATKASENYGSTTASLKDRVILNFNFKEGTLEGAAKAIISYTDHYGNEVSYEIAAEDFGTSKGRIIIAVDKLVAADARCIVTCTFVDAEGNAIDGIYAQDSIANYCARAIKYYGAGTAEANIYESIMKYSDAATTYFGK